MTVWLAADSVKGLWWVMRDDVEDVEDMWVWGVAIRMTPQTTSATTRRMRTTPMMRLRTGMDTDDVGKRADRAVVERGIGEGVCSICRESIHYYGTSGRVTALLDPV